MNESRRTDGERKLPMMAAWSVMPSKLPLDVHVLIDKLLSNTGSRNTHRYTPSYR